MYNDIALNIIITCQHQVFKASMNQCLIISMVWDKRSDCFYVTFPWIIVRMNNHVDKYLRSVIEYVDVNWTICYWCWRHVNKMLRTKPKLLNLYNQYCESSLWILFIYFSNHKAFKLFLILFIDRIDIGLQAYLLWMYKTKQNI